ncbi:MAG: penicillin-binding protein activator [Alphaproteobacteria bacterium]|nr:penicillin-binding protein activator [Alphaproteobacteria bacterium]
MKNVFLKSACFAFAAVFCACFLSACSGFVSKRDNYYTQDTKPKEPSIPPQDRGYDAYGQPAYQASPHEDVFEAPLSPPLYSDSSAPLFADVKKEKTRVAILLPLTGNNANLGKTLLNAAQLAVFDVSHKDFELMPFDTNALGARGAAEEALDAGAKLIVGPVFAQEIASVQAVAMESSVMMMPLSTDTSLADRGVFVMGLAPSDQVDAVVAYAVQKGMRNFTALIPDTVYGNLVADVFRRSVAMHGGSVAGLEMYDRSGADLQERVRSLASSSDRIDAIFIPESSDVINEVAVRLTAIGFNPQRTKILGTGTWDVARIGQKYPVLVGAWYAAPDPAYRKNFVSSYKTFYGQEPPRLASLAYDSVALAAMLSKNNMPYQEDSLTNPNGFAGLDGIFRLTPSGQVERALAVLEITPEGAKVIEGARKSFIH